MMDVSSLPTVNASLNGLATVLLTAGYIMMRQRKITAHRNFMVAAGITSAIFLACYLIYHFNVGSVKFKGTGAIKAVYLSILISHIVLAVAVAVMVPITFWRAFKNDIDRHRKIARIVFPIWMYVSITGVAIYAMLYHLYPNG